MTQIARNARTTTQPGRGEELAELLLGAVQEMIKLDLLGGKGPATAVPTAPARTPHTIRRLTDAEDAAAKHGMGAMGEARFPTRAWGAKHGPRLRSRPRRPRAARLRPALLGFTYEH